MCNKKTSIFIAVICEKQSPVMGTVPTPVESNIIPTNHITADTLTSKTHPGPGRTEEYPATLRVDKPPRSNKLDSHKPDNADMTKSKTSEIVESKSSLSNSVGRKPLVFRNSNINNTRHVGKASGQRVESSHKSGTSAAPKEPVQHTNRQRPANLHGKYIYIYICVLTNNNFRKLFCSLLASVWWCH